MKNRRLIEWVDSETTFMFALLLLVLGSCFASILESCNAQKKEKARPVCPTCGQKEGAK
jgi:DMSO reductase anchor subunit